MMPMSKWQRHIKLFYMHYQWVDVIIKRYTAAMAEKRNACAANVSCISKAYQQRQKQLDTILQDRVLSHHPF